MSLFYNFPAFLVDLGTTGIFLLIAFVFIVLGSSFLAFVMLRKTIKMAIRLIIVGIIILIAIVGSVSFLWFNSGSGGKSTKPRSTDSRSR